MKERPRAIFRIMRIENIRAAECHRGWERPSREAFRIAGDIGRNVGLLARE